MLRIEKRPARGALHPRDPRRPRRRPLALEADARRQASRRPPRQVAEGWQRRIRRAQRQGAKLDHYLELRYEDLVTDTEPNLRRIAEFLELDWDPVMLTYYERAADRMAEMARDLPADRRQADPPRRRSGCRPTR